MKDIGIEKADLDAVAEGVRRLGPDVRGYGTVDPAWSRSTAVLVIDCVLSLNRKYDAFVVPRLDAFVEKHPDISTINELASLMKSYATPHAFMQQELNFNYEDRANTLQSVVDFVCKIVEETSDVQEEKTLKQWAINAKPHEYQDLNISGFGIAGFQYLRMLFGADTTKPDVHIIRFVSNLLDRDVSALEALNILEVSSTQLGLSVRDVDTYIWEISARGQKDDDANTNEKIDDEYSEFWIPILQGELGKLFTGKPTLLRYVGWMEGKTIGDVEMWFRLVNRACYIQLYFWGENPSHLRDKVVGLFSKSDYKYENTDTSTEIRVKFPVLDKGKNDRDDWDEIREKLVSVGTDIYNKLNESDL